MNQIFSALNPEAVAAVQGFGNKISSLADTETDLYLNFVPGVKSWDMCASEAVIMANYGVACNASQEPLLYQEKKDIFSGKYTFQEGLMISDNTQKLKNTCRKIQEKFEFTTQELQKFIKYQSQVKKNQQQRVHNEVLGQDYDELAQLKTQILSFS